jgi:hypothetical protein
MAESRNNLDKNQKLALVGLTFFGVCLVGIWLLELNTEIRGPLNPKVSASNNASSTSAQAAEDKLKTQDTDGDGLSDWDEINVYHTSPYLADSDSDGIPDGEEVKNGTDPNCPQGKDCSATSIVSASSSPVVSSTVASGILSGSTKSSSTTDVLSGKLLSGQIDASTLRQILISSGKVSKTDLDKITDADLLQAYKDQLASSTKK